MISRTAVTAEQLDCAIKSNQVFGQFADIVPLCELKYIKYRQGKTLNFSNHLSEMAYQDLRISFVESNIQAIPRILFDEFRKLLILQLNGVGLRNILEESFSRADELKVFQAYGNKLTKLLGYSFVGAVNLEFLDLSSNMISNINFETFVGLDRLKELSLSNNKISIIDEQTFHPLKNLTWIWLDRNEIKIVSVNLLVNSQKLEGIHLNSNNISALSPILFDKLPELKFLFLKENNCTSKDFVNTRITQSASIKTELSKCYKEFRTIVPDEEERFRLKNVLRDAEKANAQCETDKADLLRQLDLSKQQLANLQNKNGK